VVVGGVELFTGDNLIVMARASRTGFWLTCVAAAVFAEAGVSLQP
jgi:methyl coenzyme M reductase beta subunit